MTQSIRLTIPEMGAASNNAYLSYIRDYNGGFLTDEETKKIWLERFGITLYFSNFNSELEFEFKDKEAFVLFMLEWS
jgi:hypothetical protein